MIRFDNVTKVLGGRKVLSNLTFEIRNGEVFTIVGSSGSGKSVMLKHIVRLLTPTSGAVWVDDTQVSAADGRALEKVRDRFGYLFQGGALLGWMSVYENVALPLREKTRLSAAAIDKRVMEVLKMVGLENDGDKLPNEISGGMQKRAGLARAIVCQPEIVLYDEPTSGLDPVTSRRIDALITDLRDRLGITSVVVTHDMHSALAISDRIAMLFGGRVVSVATPSGFLASPEAAVQEFLAAQFITRKPPWEQ